MIKAGNSHRKLLGLPLVGHIIFEFEIASARALGTLLVNGVSMLKAISIAVDTVDNKIIRESLQVLSPTVKSGQRISNALEENKLFTPMVIQMIRVGEESGNLDKMMLELAKVFDDHVQSGIKRPYFIRAGIDTYDGRDDCLNYYCDPNGDFVSKRSSDLIYSSNLFRKENNL